MRILLCLFFVMGQIMAGPAQKSIVNGQPVTACGWPTTVDLGGCTGTLIHPKAIATAQHCGTPSSISFGDEGGERETDVVGCVGEGSQDAQICELADSIGSLPVTPVLFGCEVDKYMMSGTEVVIAGYGQTSDGVGGGTKLWAPQTINEVEGGRCIIGTAGDGTSPCRGDSGGPVFVQVDDGSWRVFGTVWRGTSGIPCNSAADLQRIDVVVPYFEAETGIDITPCFDAETNEWEPTAECGNFYAGNDEDEGDWDNWCEGVATGPMSSECGDAYGYSALSPDMIQTQSEAGFSLENLRGNRKNMFDTPLWNIEGQKRNINGVGSLPAGVYILETE